MHESVRRRPTVFLIQFRVTMSLTYCARIMRNWGRWCTCDVAVLVEREYVLGQQLAAALVVRVRRLQHAARRLTSTLQKLHQVGATLPVGATGVVDRLAVCSVDNVAWGGSQPRNPVRVVLILQGKVERWVGGVLQALEEAVTLVGAVWSAAVRVAPRVAGGCGSTCVTARRRVWHRLLQHHRSLYHASAPEALLPLAWYCSTGALLHAAVQGVGGISCDLRDLSS